MIQRLADKLTTERTRYAEMLVKGSCNDLVQYRVLVAQVKLLDDVLDLMKDYYIEGEADE